MASKHIVLIKEISRNLYDVLIPDSDIGCRRLVLCLGLVVTSDAKSLLPTTLNNVK